MPILSSLRAVRLSSTRRKMCRDAGERRPGNTAVDLGGLCTYWSRLLGYGWGLGEE
ncbi:hypothetical protein ASPSYDRAFT_49444 [Aspergillus sydowii CBS 593.65]|uniref:Uncharacterized protein n=1 Tax=Aspergillus sydowii CBS 593.65 TaxID=1036612 RepID=A0A1L9T784_9EURO|nr:uncharacterized protein ASPSYDRAFT_49444 [Aspergillus sydowii CBS 593.65]OJJ55267.1 hypothetical protein ASPSYDRAFT_49444 [Aspergillus sydowii CBS 593.65]